MNFKKPFLVLMLSAGLLLTGCDKDKDPNPSLSTDDLESILDAPYSELTPDQQKAKLEQESIDFINALSAVSALQAIDVFENFIDLLDRSSPPDLQLDREGANPAQTIWRASNAFGVYTWNNSRWTKTASTTELRFDFPAKGITGNNNARLSLVATGSGITITEVQKGWYDHWCEVEYDDYYDYWYTNCHSEWIDEEREYIFHIPSSVTGTLSFGNEIAKIEATFNYKNETIEIEDFSTTGYPNGSEFKITTREGYEYQYKLQGTGEEVRLESQLTHNDNTLVEILFSMDISLNDIFDKIDNIEDVEELYEVYGDVNSIGFIKLMDDLVLVYQANDIANLVNESSWSDDYDYDSWYRPDYFTKEGNNIKKDADETARIFNKYMTVALASTNDGFKIAELVARSEKVDERWDHLKFLTWYEYWNKYYSNTGWSYDDFLNNFWWDGPPPGTGIWDGDEKNAWVKLYDRWDVRNYLKFNDNTLVEAEAYFSSGFGKLEKSWEDFVNSFNR